MFRHSIEASSSSTPLLLCFSHLRWTSESQRPHHLMRRFADCYRVVFVEEPVQAHEGSPSMLIRRVAEGVTVLTPLLSTHRFTSGFGGGANSEIRALLSEWLTWQDPGSHPVVWYETPMALGCCPQELSAAVVVYDVMEGSAGSSDTPHDIVRQEALLMRWADLVITGGVISETASERRFRQERANGLIGPSDWDAIVRAVRERIDAFATSTLVLGAFSGPVDVGAAHGAS